jgi:hypothetical protein
MDKVPDPERGGGTSLNGPGAMASAEQPTDVHRKVASDV